MPATIIATAQPQQYNLVVGSNVWTLGSITSNEDAYVLQLVKYNEATGNSTVIATIQQPPNPAGVAHFDVGKILQSYMDIAFVEETQQATTTLGQTLTYRARWGSVTDNIYTYNAESTLKHVFNGYVDWRELNWERWNKYVANPVASLCEGPSGYIDGDYPQRTEFMTNFPDAIPVRSSTYHTLSFVNRIGNYANGTNWGNSEQPYGVRIKWYDPSDNLIQTVIYAISGTTGLGPRTGFNQLPGGGFAYYDQQWVGTIGAGPQNLKDAGYWVQSNPAVWNLVSQVWGNYDVVWNLATTEAIVGYYTVEVCSVNMCYWDANGSPQTPTTASLIPYMGDVIYTKTFTVADPCTAYDPITVSFVNQYGVKDYYTFDRRNTYNQRIGRNDYDQVLGSWSAATYEIDPHGRGRRTFSTQIETQMTMSSYWMSDEESAWLEELFTSPHIQVYYNGVWEPAVITSNTYEQKTASRNGLFQHTLTVQFANNKKVQRG